MLYTCCKLLHAPALGDKLPACEPPQHEQGLRTLKSLQQTNVNVQKTILRMQKAFIVHGEPQQAEKFFLFFGFF